MGYYLVYEGMLKVLNKYFLSIYTHVIILCLQTTDFNLQTRTDFDTGSDFSAKPVIMVMLIA